MTSEMKRIEEEPLRYAGIRKRKYYEDVTHREDDSVRMEVHSYKPIKTKGFQQPPEDKDKTYNCFTLCFTDRVPTLAMFGLPSAPI